jgi:hypothetical protein
MLPHVACPVLHNESVVDFNCNDSRPTWSETLGFVCMTCSVHIFLLLSLSLSAHRRMRTPHCFMHICVCVCVRVCVCACVCVCKSAASNAIIAQLAKAATAVLCLLSFPSELPFSSLCRVLITITRFCLLRSILSINSPALSTLLSSSSLLLLFFILPLLLPPSLLLQ